MENVSREYLEMMKSPLRERAYAKLFLECFDLNYMKTCTISWGNEGSLLRGYEELGGVYFTAESTFTIRHIALHNTVQPNFTSMRLSCRKGMYPTSITVTFQSPDGGYSDRTITGEIWGDDVWFNLDIRHREVRSIDVTVHDDIYIDKVYLGRLMEFGNDDIITSSFVSDFSYANTTLPQMDLTVGLYNGDDRYDYLNGSPDGMLIVEQLRKGNKIRLDYGQALKDGSIEWVKGYDLFISGYDVSSTLNISAVDMLRNMDKEFTNQPVAYDQRYDIYDTLIAIFQEAGITNYYISRDICVCMDTHTGEPVTAVATPLEGCSLKEALQIMCAYCDLTLKFDRSGRINITKREDLEGSSVYFETISEGDYTESVTTVHEGDTAEPVRFGSDYIPVTNTGGSAIHPLPTLYKKRSDNTDAYCSKHISSADGVLAQPITLHVDVGDKNINSLVLKSGYNHVEEIKVEWIANDTGNTVHHEKTLTITPTEYVVPLMMQHCGAVDITITKVKYANAPVFLQYNSELNNLVAFSIEPIDVLTKPIVKYYDIVSKMLVKGKRYSLATDKSEVEYVMPESHIAGDKVYVYCDDVILRPIEIRYTYGGKEYRCSNFIDQKLHYVTFRCETPIVANTSITFQVDRLINKETSYTSETTNVYGVNIEITNPLSDGYSSTDSSFLKNILRDYDKYDVSYSYRGDPEIDVGDLIYETLPNNHFHSKAMITHVEINMNQTLRGSITCRRERRL